MSNYDIFAIEPRQRGGERNWYPVPHGAAHKQKVQTEECIYLKYKKDAEKFLDKDCQRYVRYKQDN